MVISVLILYLLLVQYYYVCDMLLNKEKYNIRNEFTELYSYIKKKCMTPFKGLYYIYKLVDK